MMQLKPLFISLMCLVQAHAVQAREYPSPSALRGAADIQKETLIKQLDDSKYAIEMGDLIMVVDAGHGGKILSFKCQDVEVISQSPMRETFGSTFWTSPQKEWNWPPVQEYDKMPYSVEEEEGTLILNSQVSDRLKYRIRKEFATDKKDNSFVITYSIINESGVVRRVAPWEITRVPNEDGLIFFDASVAGITPAGLMAFTSAEGVSWYRADAADSNRKINADGKGWLAYKNQHLLLVKKFQDLTPTDPAPDEAEIQVYVNRGKTYIELESQGAYTELKPMESLSWTVRWYLLPDSSPVEASKQLIQKVKKVIK